MDDTVRQWHDHMMSDGPWYVEPDPPSVNHTGASHGLFVRHGVSGRLAFMKPTDVFHDHTPWPTVDKISTDIALDVGIPVAPVLLFRRPDAPRGVENRVSVSLVLHEEFFDWPPDWIPTPEERAAALACLGPASGVVALDTYLQNVDRNDRRPNTVFYQPVEPGMYEPAFIDFSNCLNRQDRWMSGGWKSVRMADMPGLLRQAISPQAVLETVQRIEALSDGRLEELVNRVPDDFLTPNRKATVLAALKERRPLVRAALSDFLPA